MCIVHSPLQRSYLNIYVSHVSSQIFCVNVLFWQMQFNRHIVIKHGMKLLSLNMVKRVTFRMHPFYLRPYTMKIDLYLRTKRFSVNVVAIKHRSGLKNTDCRSDYTNIHFCLTSLTFHIIDTCVPHLETTPDKLEWCACFIRLVWQVSCQTD